MHSGSNSSIPRLLHFLKEKWWIPALLGLAGLATSAWLAYHRAPDYASMGRLWVSGKLHIAQESFYAEEIQNFYGTQVELLKSETIQMRARAKVDTDYPDIKQRTISLTVNQLPKAAVIDIKAVSPDGRFAELFLEALMNSYLAYKTESRTYSADDTYSSLGVQLKDQEEELKLLQDKLREFQALNNEVVLQERGASVASYLAQKQVQLADARMDLQLLDTVMDGSNSVNKAAGAIGLGAEAEELVPGFKGAQSALTPMQQVRFLEMKRTELGKYLQEGHPKMIKLNEVISRQRELLTFFEEQNAEELAKTRHALIKKMGSLEESIKEWEVKGLDASKKMADYDGVRADIKRSQGVFDRLLELQQNVDVGRKLDQENVSILQKASPPVPVYANLPMRMGLGLILGSLIGLGILYMLERVDDRITSVQTLQSSIKDTHVVGQIPEVNGHQNPATTLLKLGDQRHMFVEAYRNIRSSLVFMSMAEMRPKTLLITSAVPGEGKSTVSVNLAQTLALAGGRVLLIDGDLRRGSLNSLFGIPSSPGLVEVLEGKVDVDSAIKETSRPNLWFLSCGKRTGGPGELLMGSATDILLSRLYARYDYIVMDSAPVLAADDTVSVAPKMDGVVMVVRESFTRASAGQQALDQLTYRQAKVLGVVLNRVNQSSRQNGLYKYTEYFSPAIASS